MSKNEKVYVDKIAVLEETVKTLRYLADLTLSNNKHQEIEIKRLIREKEEIKKTTQFIWN